MASLSPGSKGRRYNPEGGLQKYRDRIHRESEFADKHKNLPFSFSKPKKSKRHITAKCKSCGSIVSVPVNTVGMICTKCKKYSSVEVLN